MTDKTLEDLELERDEAEERRRKHESKVREEIRLARNEVERIIQAKHDAETKRLTEEKRAAYLAWESRLDKEASHPFEGRKVTRAKPGWRSRGVMEKGVVEVRRSTTRFGNAGSYRVPALGRPFVRLLKSDGTPGLRIAELYENEDGSLRNWTPVDEGAK